MGTWIEKALWVAFSVPLTAWLAFRVWRGRDLIRPAELPALDSDLQQYESAIAALIAERRARNVELKNAQR